MDRRAQRSGIDPSVLRRMSKERAIIRIAKKLLNRVRHVWLKQTAYVVSVVE